MTDSEHKDASPSPPPLPHTPVSSGLKVGGRYVTRAILGRGGMGVVYHAVEEEIERDVALKFIIVDPQMSEEEREAYYARFRQEAQALGSLPPHPNRVVLYQYGHDAENDLHYMAMELVRGVQLSEVMQTRALSIDQIVDYTRQIALALEDVHASGLVHRDLKPENLIVTRSLLGDEQLKLIDFGIARAPAKVPDTSESDDEERELHGTVLYMAPELLVDGVQDARTDIYAIGVILFELTCGVGPFAHVLSAEDHEDVMALVKHHVRTEIGPIKPCAGVGEVPRDFETLIRRCLAKEPDERFRDASELLEALDTIVADKASLTGGESGDEGIPADLARQAEVRVLPEESAGPPVTTTAVGGPTGLVAAADAGGDTRIWNIDNGNEVWFIPAPEEPGASQAKRTRLTFSDDGRLLALGDRMGRLWLCDVELRTKEIIELSDGAPIGLAFDRSMALMVVTTSAGTIELWDLPNRAQLTRLKPDINGRRARPGEIRAVALSPQRQFLVAGFSDGTLHLWDFLDKTRSGPMLGPPPLPGSWPLPRVDSPASIVYIGVSADGSRLAAIRAGGFAEIWDTNEKSLVHRIELPEDESPRRLCFGEDNQVLVAYNSGAVVLLDASEGAVLDAVHIPRGKAVNIGYSADGVPLASIARGSTVQVWDVLRRGRVQTVGPYRSVLLDVTFAAYGDTVLTLASGGYIDRWDLLTGRHLGRVFSGARTVRSLNKAPEPGRILLCGSRDGVVALEGFGLNGMNPIQHVPLPIPPPPDRRRVSNYAISRDQRFVALGYAQGEVEVYAYHEDSEPLELGANHPPVTAMAFSPDNRFLAVAHKNGVLNLWDLAATAIAWQESSARMPIHFVTFTPSGRLLSIPRGGTIEVWNMESRRRVARMSGHEGPIRTMVHGLEGRLLLTASDDGTARLWDVAAQRNLRVIDGHSGPVTAATLDPDLRYLLTTSGPYLSVWRVSDAELLARFVYLGTDKDGDRSSNRWVSFSPLGHHTASHTDLDEVQFLTPGSRVPISDAERRRLFDPRTLAARLVG